MINSVELTEEGENILIPAKLTEQRTHFIFLAFFTFKLQTHFQNSWDNL